MTGRIERIRRHRFVQRFHRLFVTAGGLKHETQQIQGVNVSLRVGENLIAEDLSAVQVALRVILTCLGHQRGYCEETFAFVRCWSLRARATRSGSSTPCFSVHVGHFKRMPRERQLRKGYCLGTPIMLCTSPLLAPFDG